MSTEKMMFVLKYNNLDELNCLFEDGWYVNQLSSCANSYGYQCFVYLERTPLKCKKTSKELKPEKYEDLPF